MFSCEFCEISKNTFFTEHLWTTASSPLGKDFQLNILLATAQLDICKLLKFKQKSLFMIFKGGIQGPYQRSVILL